MQTALITSTASVIAVVLGFITTYLLNRRMERQRNQLARVNAQLSQLYGPIYAITQSSGIAFREFTNRYDPMRLFDNPDADSDPRITDMQKASYRKWLGTVFQPNNKKILEILLTKTDLLIDGDMPASALTFFAHVAGYDVILQDWESGDLSSLFSLVDYPEEFSLYISKAYKALQEKQSRLLA